MSRIVLLDAGPLGLVTNPRYSEQSLECAQWLQALVERGSRVVIPEIADYEVRRELIRARKGKGLARLDALDDTNISPRGQAEGPEDGGRARIADSVRWLLAGAVGSARGFR